MRCCAILSARRFSSSALCKKWFGPPCFSTPVGACWPCGSLRFKHSRLATSYCNASQIISQSARSSSSFTASSPARPPQSIGSLTRSFAGALSGQKRFAPWHAVDRVRPAKDTARIDDQRMTGVAIEVNSLRIHSLHPNSRANPKTIAPRRHHASKPSNISHQPAAKCGEFMASASVPA